MQDHRLTTRMTQGARYSGIFFRPKRKPRLAAWKKWREFLQWLSKELIPYVGDLDFRNSSKYFIDAQETHIILRLKDQSFQKFEKRTLRSKGELLYDVNIDTYTPCIV